MLVKREEVRGITGGKTIVLLNVFSVAERITLRKGKVGFFKWEERKIRGRGGKVWKNRRGKTREGLLL